MREQGRSQLTKVFRYLEALNERRNPPQVNIDRYEFRLNLLSLPDHALIALGEDFVLKVGRPAPTTCPAPSASLRPWLADGWEKVTSDPQLKEPDPSLDLSDMSESQAVLGRQRDFDLWLPRWKEWASIRKTEIAVQRIYEDLYEQHTVFEREGERFELILGNGFVKSSSLGRIVNHPVLLQPIELTFDPQQAEFTIVETTKPVEFYSSPLRGGEDVSHLLAQLRKQVQENPEIHPLDDAYTTPFLRGLATSLGAEFVESPPVGLLEDVVIFESPIIFRRNRNTGLAQAIDQVLEDLSEEPTENSIPSWFDEPPEGLLRFMGIETRPDVQAESVGEPTSRLEDDEATYFTKPANHEQYQIVQKLRATGCVLVQGPPGTGKTHTIANLIGHLLAEGKSVLVTSHTTKALSVVTEKVVEPLQPLCVSVLESDRENRGRIESAVSAMADRLSVGKEVYLRRSVELKEKRSRIMVKIRELRARLRSARASEYDPIAYRGDAFSPVEAAKHVAKRQSEDGWIPGLIGATDFLPLSHQEFLDLYESNVSVTAEDEANYPDLVPDISRILAPEHFQSLLSSTQLLRATSAEIPKDAVVRPPTNDPSVVNRAISSVEDALRIFENDENGWKRQIIDLAQRSEASTWTRLAQEVESLITQVQPHDEAILRVAPKWSKDIVLSEAISCCNEIEQHLSSGKKLSSPLLLVKPRWNKVVKGLTVADGPPSTVEHFAVARVAIESRRSRDEFCRVWNGRMSEINGPAIPASTEKPERSASPYTADIRLCVAWHQDILPKVETTVLSTGLSLKAALMCVPAGQGPAVAVDRLVRSLDQVILTALRCMAKRIDLAFSEASLAQAKGWSEQLAIEHPSVPLLGELARAAKCEDADAYRLAFIQIGQVYGKGTIIVRRRTLLSRLGQEAPEWAQAIRLRDGDHATKDLPGNPEAAWKWKHLAQHLLERAAVSIQDLISSLAERRQECEQTTIDLVEALSWHSLMRRSSISMRQALTGYVQTLRRIGRGTGKRVPQLIQEAQKLMADSQKAVPVWVMPLSRIIDSFNVGKAKFDVVIVDEASQLDLNGLLAMYMAKQVVIVGDDKQVEPLAVGTNIDEIQSLINEHLRGIPRHHLWDGKQSVYSLADGSFDPIRLREHFRCVPDIIRFSNQLSYDGSILPLREDAGVETRPFVAPFYVENAYSDGRINKQEALALVGLLKGCCEQKEYDEKTFGVIHLVGDDQSAQSKYVEQLARQYLGDIELEKRKFRCGNSAQFQGDERHVMFLSVVDVPGDGPLRMRSEDLYKKRFNVAASRAQDQMWVVYSLNPDTDLQAGDLRRDLITFALDPRARDRLYQANVGVTESDFEKRVLRYLIDAGYTIVKPQYWVGAYRLEFAIRQGSLKVAIECDGEQFHGSDKLDEDIARQATLERLGWRFIRIRCARISLVCLVDESSTMLIARSTCSETGGVLGNEYVEARWIESLSRSASKSVSAPLSEIRPWPASRIG